MAIADPSAGGAVMTATASETGLSGVVESGAAVGGGLGLEIEKGPSSDALRLEELKAELQAATAAKKKVGRVNVPVSWWLPHYTPTPRKDESSGDRR